MKLKKYAVTVLGLFVFAIFLHFFLAQNVRTKRESEKKERKKERKDGYFTPKHTARLVTLY
jgi:hypothetical protein